VCGSGDATGDRWQKPVEKTIRVNLYYTGLTDTAKIREADVT
jgi:hypothetical protein